MVQIAQLIGGAGTGKTTALLELMDHAIERYCDPFLVGFCSFTKAARREASRRAGFRFDVKPSDLESKGWFRTLHSICYRQLKVGEELLTGKKEDLLWLQESLGDSSAAAGGSLDEELSFDGLSSQNAPGGASVALALWSAARNRLSPLQPIWMDAWRCDQRIPSYEQCKATIERYENAKALWNRLDFTDMLTKYAGYRCCVDGVEKREPDGEIPDVPVWLLDEQQDASPLLHAVCDRLISNSEWCYVVGDPYQALYGWAGADPAMFMAGWDYVKTKTMPKSWRCPREILELGERILSNCSDYFDRHIAPADHEGRIEVAPQSLTSSILDPREDWLVLARTNFLVHRIGAALNKAVVPWVNTKGGGNWNAPVKNRAIRALTNLAAGAPIDGLEWKSIVSLVPSKSRKETMFVRGTKAKWKKFKDKDAIDYAPLLFLDNLLEFGATPQFIAQVRKGLASEWIPQSSAVITADARWGSETVDAPKIRVGTIHSAKGMEAENVAVLLSQSMQCERGKATESGKNESHRIAYVAVTRAKKQLVLLENQRKDGVSCKIDIPTDIPSR